MRVATRLYKLRTPGKRPESVLKGPLAILRPKKSPGALRGRRSHRYGHIS
jgi:hypothetical protein